MSTGKINVSVENIFPLIKKFLYSDHEIFLRELISNATDATLKLKHLSNIGEAKGDFGEPKIEVKIDAENKTLSIIDQGIGMTQEEVENETDFINCSTFHINCMWKEAISSLLCTANQRHTWINFKMLNSRTG